VQATEMLLVSHWFLIPFLMCVWVTSPIWTGILTFVQVAFFWSLNSIATELENPFGEDTNDLPAQAMQQDFNQELLLLLRPSTSITAKLSHKATLTLNEMQELRENRKMSLGSSSMGRTMTLSKNGVSEPPRHQRRSSLEGNSISLGGLQQCINTLEARNYVSESVCESEYNPPINTPSGGSIGMFSRGLAPTDSRALSKENELPPVGKVRLGGDSPQSAEAAEPEGGEHHQRTSDDGHPGSDETLRLRQSGTPKACRAPAEGLPSCDGSTAPSGLRPCAAEQKCAESPLAKAKRQLLAPELESLPHLLAVCEEMCDQLKAFHPEIVSEHLACLPELVQLARENREPARYLRHPATGPAAGKPLHFGPWGGSAGAETPPGLLDAELQLRHTTVHRGAGNPLDGGCVSLRSCVSSQQSQWSTKVPR